jgi:hypothetical protein
MILKPWPFGAFFSAPYRVNVIRESRPCERR